MWFFGQLFVFITVFASFSQADEILCERKPTAYLVGESKPIPTEKSPCSATAKIQAIAYECGETMDTLSSTIQFLKDNKKKAREKCIQFCEEYNPVCTGRTVDQTTCGFSIPTNRALDAGINVAKCPKHCKGQAFNYCSLYHANFFAVDPALFTSKAANCICYKR